MTKQSYISGGPAFTSLLPDFPRIGPAPDKVNSVAGEYCGCHVDIVALGTPSEEFSGRYIITEAGSGRQLFLKIFKDSIVRLQRHSDTVAEFLSGHGLTVICALDGEPRPILPGYHGMLFPYLDARFSTLTTHELYQIGEVIAKLHSALLVFPRLDEVARTGKMMFDRLKRTANNISTGFIPAGAPAQLVQLAARSFLVGSWDIFRCPQMIHGDCNYTNFLFERTNNQVWVIDFEESLAAWLNPAFDLAMVLQRFVLMAPSDQTEQLAQALFNGYDNAGGRLPTIPNFYTIIKEITLRSVLILSEKVGKGMQIPQAEWTKFERLMEMAYASKDFLVEIRP